MLGDRVQGLPCGLPPAAAVGFDDHRGERQTRAPAHFIITIITTIIISMAQLACFVSELAQVTTRARLSYHEQIGS